MGPEHMTAESGSMMMLISVAIHGAIAVALAWIGYKTRALESSLRDNTAMTEEVIQKTAALEQQSNGIQQSLIDASAMAGRADATAEHTEAMKNLAAEISESLRDVK